MRSRFRTLSFALLLPVVLAGPLLAGPPSHANNVKHVTVMTRNVYLGASLTPVVLAIMGGDPEQIVLAVSGVWGMVRSTDFPARAESLAREIESAQPDLIGLQEAEVWRSQTPADFVPGNAEHVEYDFVRLLLDALSARGLHYAEVVRATGVDVEVPGFLSEADFANGVISDIRLTEHEVILARTDLKTSELKLSNPQSGPFVNNVEFPVGEGTVVVLRSWVSVDAKVRGKSFRFVSTHLEADDPDIRDKQAMEVLNGPANTTLAVVLVADANSNANGTTETPLTGPETYNIFIGAGFTDAWFEAHPGEFVTTCCNAPDLTNPVFPDAADDEGRIDLVLYRGPRDFSTLWADLFGTNTTDRVSNGLALIWPSDHAGVAAKLQIRN